MGNKKALSENDLIKNDCKIDCRWDNKTSKWHVKISHITDDIAYTSVAVTMEGFDNFRDATDEAVRLFKRNIRNDIRDRQPLRVKYSAEDYWPEFLTEPI